MVITCPYCGTNHLEFQSNCKNCGAPLPAPEQVAEAARRRQLVMPPPPPREIANSFAWKLMFTDGWGIVSLILLFMGVVFAITGGGLTLGLITAIVGLPFLCLGVGFLGGGAYLFNWRWGIAQTQLNVLRHGQSATGEVTKLEQDYNVTVNGRNPWRISYKFNLKGEEYQGVVTTLNDPADNLAPGRPVAILYLPDAPQHNGLYPHP